MASGDQQKHVVYIYNGPGAGEESLKMADLSLKSCLSENYSVQLIDDKGISEGRWCDEAALVVFPGGADTPYVQRLHGAGCNLIKKYVSDGGRYLGLCAGAYFASSFVEFDKGGPLEVIGSRELAFFPGPAIGPVLAPYDYNSKSGSRAVCIHWHDDTFGDEPLYVFYNGGCYFDMTSVTKDAPVAVLATYKIENSSTSLPAIVQTRIQKGCAILSGVHFEFDPYLLVPDNVYYEKIIPVLKQHDAARKQLLRHILGQLGLVCSPQL